MPRPEKMDQNQNQNPNMKTLTPLLLLNLTLLATGFCGGPMLMRLYFTHGGNRVWLSSWLETAGWPIIFIPLLITHHNRRKKGSAMNNGSFMKKIFLMKGPLFIATAIIGILIGLDDYLYAYAVANLPVSTVALMTSTKLAFTAVFGFLLVKQKFTPYSVNAVVLLTVSAGVLALHSGGDQPKAESKREYFMGFFMIAIAMVLYGFILPLVELMYKKAKQDITFTLVLEINLVMCFFATLFCTIGMLINKDFKAIPKEARDFELGEATYYGVLVGIGIMFQFVQLGTVGVIFTASSLLSAVTTAVLLPVVEILAVIFFRERFDAEKGVSLVLSLWGFASYYYGGMKHRKETSETQVPDEEMPQSISVSK